MVARYWSSSRGYSSEITAEEWDEADAIVVWHPTGELAEIALRATESVVVCFEADVSDQSFRVGVKRDRLRSGLWLEVPAIGHLKLAQYTNGVQKMFLATRGRSRYDFAGIRTESGEYEIASDELRWSGEGDNPDTAMKSLWEGVDSLPDTWFSAAGLLDGFASSSWMIGIDSSDNAINGVRTCSGKWLAEIPVSSLHDGIVRLTSLSDGCSQVLEPSKIVLPE